MSNIGSFFFQIARQLDLIVPRFVKAIIFNAIARRRFDIRIGKGAIVYPDSFLGGMNYISSGVVLRRSNIGRFSYFAPNSKISGLKVGNFCAIGRNLNVMLGMHPVDKFVSIHPIFYSASNSRSMYYTPLCDYDLFPTHKYVDPDKKYVVQIGSDVWIGDNVTIMDGINVHDGAVIAAGAVVTHDVLPYSIVAGVPAREIRRRFSEEKIRSLLEIKWWDRSYDWITKNAAFFRDVKNDIWTCER